MGDLNCVWEGGGLFERRRNRLRIYGTNRIHLGCYKNSDLRPWQPQSPEKLRPLDVLKTSSNIYMISEDITVWFSLTLTLLHPSVSKLQRVFIFVWWHKKSPSDLENICVLEIILLCHDLELINEWMNEYTGMIQPG